MVFLKFFLVGPWLGKSKREKSLVCQLGMNERWNEFAVSKLNRDSLILLLALFFLLNRAILKCYN
jgi:hypothetical protein